jgi:large subunit ribosomal protein L22
MTGLKTNERPGTRAVVKFVRVSPSKARAVLDLVRGESSGRASEILAFSERSVSEVVGKCLDSAVANAENNDGIAAEELFVSACYADEGPTLKRWRPRARGRATQILKRTSHITIIVSRYDDATLADFREREEAKGRAGSSTHAAEARRQRVERSRAAAEAAAAAEEAAAHDHDHEGHDHADEVEAVETVEAEVTDEEQAEEQAAEQVADQQDEEESN